MKMIDTLIENDLKIAELKILRFLYKNGESKKTHIEKGCSLNFYQITINLPLLIKLGLIIENGSLYSINKKSPLVIKLIEEIEE